MSEENSNEEEPDFFSYTDRTLFSSVSRLVVNNETKLLRRLLKKRKSAPEPLSIDNRGWTAFHIAASRADRIKCLELLLKYGDSVLIDLDSLTFENKTALYIACEANCEQNVLLLLQKGCNPNIKTREEMSPLKIAADKGYDEIVTHLLRYGANIDDQNWEGFTALHLAAFNGNTEIGRILLNNGANFEIKDNMGNLAIHLASLNDYIDFVRLILDKKLSIVDVKNKDNYTALSVAVQSGSVNCIRYLINKGAKLPFEMMDSIYTYNMPDNTMIEMTKLFIEHLNRDDVEEYYCSYASSRKMFYPGKSMVCHIIDLGSAECLSLLLESDLPKFFLQAPCLLFQEHMMTPLSYLLDKFDLSIENKGAMLDLLLKHEIIFIDEYLKILNRLDLLESFQQYLTSKLTKIGFNSVYSLESFEFFHKILKDKNVTVDYWLQCCHSNVEKVFSDLDYNKFYGAVLSAGYANNVKLLEFCIRNSSILEPDMIAMKLIEDKLCCKFETDQTECFHSSYNYLITLTPIFYRRCTFWESHKKFVWEYFSPVAEEFAKSTLQQFCRTKIRQLVRGKTIEDNLLNFRRRINQLPLPTGLKNYLLFQD